MVFNLALLLWGCGGARSEGAVDYASALYECPAEKIRVLEARESEKIAAYWLDICGSQRRFAQFSDDSRAGAKPYWKDVTPPLVRAFGTDQSREKEEQTGRIREAVDDMVGRKVTTLSYYVPDSEIYVQVVADTEYPDSYSLRYASAEVDPEFARFRSCESFNGKADGYRWSSSRPEYDGQRRNDVMFELIGVGVRGEQLQKLARAKDARVRFCGTTFTFAPLQRGKLNEFLRTVGYAPNRPADKKSTGSTSGSSEGQKPGSAQTMLPKNVGVEPLDGLGVFKFRMSLEEAKASCAGARVAKRQANKVHLLCPDAEIAGTIDWDGAAAVFEKGQLVELNYGWAAANKQDAIKRGEDNHARVLRMLTERLGEHARAKVTCEGGTPETCASLEEKETVWTHPNQVTLTFGEVSKGVYGIRLKAQAP